MSDAWVCLMVNVAFKHGEKGAVEREVASVFGDDLFGVRTVCNDTMKSSTGEYYMFVKCSDWESHVERVERSSAVASVVPSYRNPHMFSKEEIDAFEGSTVEKKPGVFKRGDMVLVKEGYLKNLYGVVVSTLGEKRCKVAFSFHLRKFSENISVTWLKMVANIFERRVKSLGKGAHTLAKRRNLRGKKG